MFSCDLKARKAKLEAEHRLKAEKYKQHIEKERILREQQQRRQKEEEDYKLLRKQQELQDEEALREEISKETERNGGVYLKVNLLALALSEDFAYTKGIKRSKDKALLPASVGHRMELQAAVSRNGPMYFRVEVPRRVHSATGFTGVTGLHLSTLGHGLPEFNSVRRSPSSSFPSQKASGGVAGGSDVPGAVAKVPARRRKGSSVGEEAAGVDSGYKCGEDRVKIRTSAQAVPSCDAVIGVAPSSSSSSMSCSSLSSNDGSSSSTSDSDEARRGKTRGPAGAMDAARASEFECAEAVGYMQWQRRRRGRCTHVGVLGFSAPEGTVLLPPKVVESLWGRGVFLKSPDEIGLEKLDELLRVQLTTSQQATHSSRSGGGAVPVLDAPRDFGGGSSPFTLGFAPSPRTLDPLRPTGDVGDFASGISRPMNVDRFASTSTQVAVGSSSSSSRPAVPVADGEGKRYGRRERKDSSLARHSTERTLGPQVVTVSYRRLEKGTHVSFQPLCLEFQEAVSEGDLLRTSLEDTLLTMSVLTKGDWVTVDVASPGDGAAPSQDPSVVGQSADAASSVERGSVRATSQSAEEMMVDGEGLADATEASVAGNPVQLRKRRFHLQVTEVRPGRAVSIVDTDLNAEVAPSQQGERLTRQLRRREAYERRLLERQERQRAAAAEAAVVAKAREEGERLRAVLEDYRRRIAIAKSLPPEPSGPPSPPAVSCAIRLPDGRRIQRKFDLNAPVDLLFDFVDSYGVDPLAAEARLEQCGVDSTLTRVPGLGGFAALTDPHNPQRSLAAEQSAALVDLAAECSQNFGTLCVSSYKLVSRHPRVELVPTRGLPARTSAHASTLAAPAVGSVGKPEEGIASDSRSSPRSSADGGLRTLAEATGWKPGANVMLFAEHVVE